jgi:TolA-binding protein
MFLLMKTLSSLSSSHAPQSYACALVVVFFCHAFAEKVLIYDEEKGIIFVDKEASSTQKKEPSGIKPMTPSPSEKERVRSIFNGKTVDATIQRGRRKDPPEVYFESGLQYFKNGNYDDALKNFTHSDSLDPQPKYVLWMGKTLRHMHKYDRLLFVMNRLVSTYPESDVADDALFEIAFCYQTNDEYETAEKTYTKLAEQYPFGTSYSNGESFRAIANKQCRIMRSEIISTLKILGFNGDDIETLYSAFQKDRGLPVTGAGNRATVKAIKAAYGDYLKMQAARALQQERIGKYRTAAFSLCGLLFINCLVLFTIRRKIALRIKNLAILSQTLSDLSIGSL